MAASIARRSTARKRQWPAESTKELVSLQFDQTAIHRAADIAWRARRIRPFENRRPLPSDQIDRAAGLADKLRKRRIHQRSENRVLRVPTPAVRVRARQAFPRGILDEQRGERFERR